ncbi:RNase adapter RapZ [Psychrobium sp. 1_MG-2023]|uniref:RNase adapter RapZ n=1 Tax=Psychrobium sp. 1_MG-2023 TaxID=3062624 RepID=UPI000C3200F0|nr:RNase adapter RapZ [Psychrobium sp. 1_MG-2023]MDP2560707.1 RNase adapter RapZ [Psychrobium sp. 1_MG-2023]PKF56746.1 RNase adapter RapZ [Alteromonadales bacterium alter-6D02]
MKLTIISGTSGSGKSVALRVLEDLGYYCVDNLPMNLLHSFIDSMKEMEQPVAVSLDVRNIPSTQSELSQLIEQLSASCDLEIVFLDAPSTTLIKRYSETRRLHPLTKQCMTLSEAVKEEKSLLRQLAEVADLKIDTGELTIYQLSDLIKERILGNTDSELVLVFESFGFKYGLPRDVDFVFDVRFLPNPHWEPELRPLTGLDAPVQQYLAAEPLVNQLEEQLTTFIDTWLPHLEKNNRSYLTIAIGCTGGQHRSVYIAQQLAKNFSHKKHNIQIHHREMFRKAKT